MNIDLECIKIFHNELLIHSVKASVSIIIIFVFWPKNLGILKVLFQASCAWKKYLKKEKCVSSSKCIFHKLSTVTVSKVSHLPLVQSFQSVLSVTTANRNIISCWPWSVLIQSTLFMKKLFGCCWHWEQNNTLFYLFTKVLLAEFALH